jgi:hypothetical protein
MRIILSHGKVNIFNLATVDEFRKAKARNGSGTIGASNKYPLGPRLFAHAILGRYAAVNQMLKSIPSSRSYSIATASLTPLHFAGDS